MTNRTLFSILVLLTSWNLYGQVADAGPSPYLCGTNFDMFANVPEPPATGLWSLISGCGNVADQTDPFTPVVGSCVGENVWQWTIFGPNGATSDIMTITVFDDQLPAADAGQDITVVLPSTSAQLQGSPDPNPPVFCTWTLVAGTATIVSPNDPNTMISSLTVGSNVFQWSCDNGPCGITSDQVTVTVSPSTGIAQNEADMNWLRYDLTTQQLSLNTGGSVDRFTVQDISGRMVSDLGNGARTWSVAGKPAGVYIAKAMVNGYAHVLRFVVQ
ncbi:MAG: hypothetical protein IPI00_15410 [Flavobacteriales bacterium]|nr:hypothetical protein [Flavobacteriales bacterium]